MFYETINTKFRDVKEHAFGNIKFEYLCPYVQDFMKRLSKLIYDDNFQYVEKNDPGPDCGFEIDLDDRGWHLESDLQMTYKDNLLYDDPLFKDMYLLVEWGAWSVQIDSTTGELYTFVGDYYDSKEPYEHASFIEWWEMSLSKFLLDVQSHQSK